MRTNWFRLAGFGAATFFSAALVLGVAGCKSNPATTAAPIVNGDGGGDPADANMAQPLYSDGQPAQVLSASSSAPQQATGEAYPQQQAQYPQNESQQQAAQYDQTYDQDQAAVDAGQAALYADQAPPELPVYQQPELTDPGYEWTPGYWSYGGSGYYWVPGAWVAPPYAGALWTPGYWGSYGGRYRFHYGFWGPHIGFYGGINYGFGYTGTGYYGGYWQGNNFYYNRQVNRVNTSVVRNVYAHNVAEARNYSRVSYNGPRGMQARPTAAEVAVYHERIVPQMHVQAQAAQAAAANRQQSYAENHGRPATVVSNERFAADRTPPEAIRPAPPVVVARPQPQRPGATANEAKPNPERPNTERPGEPNNFNRPGVNPAQPGREQPAQREQQMREQQQHPVQPQNVRPEAAPRPAPEARPQPESRPQPRPVPEARPAPEARPVPQARPAPQPREVRPEPTPQARPAPEARPAPQPHPAPEARPAPHPAPEAHPAPTARPEPPKDEHPR